MARVVAALIRKPEDESKILICQRPAGKKLALLWEFPGGKVEPGETDAQAVVRECREELGAEVKPGRQVMVVEHEYPDFTIQLALYDALLTGSEPQMLEHNDMRWITTNELSEFEFCPADEAILDVLRGEAG